LLPVIIREATDERNFVKKAVNWALRNIGKRNLNLNEAAINTAREIKRRDSKAARWIAADAIRELESDAIQSRLRRWILVQIVQLWQQKLVLFVTCKFFPKTWSILSLISLPLWVGMKAGTQPLSLNLPTFYQSDENLERTLDSVGGDDTV